MQGVYSPTHCPKSAELRKGWLGSVIGDKALVDTKDGLAKWLAGVRCTTSACTGLVQLVNAFLADDLYQCHRPGLVSKQISQKEKPRSTREIWDRYLQYFHSHGRRDASPPWTGRRIPHRYSRLDRTAEFPQDRDAFDSVAICHRQVESSSRISCKMPLSPNLFLGPHRHRRLSKSHNFL